jgi:hypothetical protein
MPLPTAYRDRNGLNYIASAGEAEIVFLSTSRSPRAEPVNSAAAVILSRLAEIAAYG